MILKRARKGRMFRFLELPGGKFLVLKKKIITDLFLELRNRIYEFAAEVTRKEWPNLPTRSSVRPKRRKLPESETHLKTERSIFPFLGLTQTCTDIRSEFRGWWMESHCIPLCELERYISVFLPILPKKDRKRHESYFKTTGRVTIRVRNDELEDVDILRLLKLKARLPNYTVLFRHLANVDESVIFGLLQFVCHANPKWLRWIRANVITQVRLCKSVVHIVVREQWAQDWMKPCTKSNQASAAFRTAFGLDRIVHWDFVFSVSYA
jgi:hypothetical protein